MGYIPNSFLSIGNKAPIKLIEEVVLQNHATPAIINLTKEGKKEKIRLTTVEMTIGRTQYPKTHIVCIIELLL